MPSSNFQTRVLLVDDEPNILATMSAVLEASGFVVRTAEDGFAALKTLRELLPDIIITDLRMPNMSGFEFLSVVRRRFPQIPVIAVSGEFIADPVPATLLADAFFEKGNYKPHQIMDAIRKLVAESPIRPQLGKCRKVPVWIPLSDAGYFVATCPDCLRSFPIDNSHAGDEVQNTECTFCGTTVEYIIDSSVLKKLAARTENRKVG